MERLPPIDPQILARLDTFVQRIVHATLEGASRRALARTYVRGLLGPSARKNVEQIIRAERGVASAPAHEKRMTAMLRDDAWRHGTLMWEGAARLVARDDGWRAYTIDDTACLKQGDDSVGVQVQYAGCVGDTANCQVLVTLGIAQEHASAPLAVQLFLPQGWADDAARRARCGVPDDVAFETKTAIALALARRLHVEGLPRLPVLADSAYGDVVAFRDALTALGFPWVVGLGLTTTVWPAGLAFETVSRQSHRGRPSVRVRPTTPVAPRTVAAFAMTLPTDAWREVCWREGSRGPQIARFAAVRVRPSHGWNHGGIHPDALCEEAWLLVHWSLTEPAPTKAWLASLPADAPLETLVGLARLRWRVERDNREGKGLAGLDHYEGRTWQGLHHHAAFVVLAQQFLATERLAALAASGPPTPVASTPTPAANAAASPP